MVPGIIILLCLFLNIYNKVQESQCLYARVIAMGDSMMQRREDDKALMMYMLVGSRINDRMTETAG